MKKRLLSLLLVFCMVFTMIPMGAFATAGNTLIGTSSIQDATLCEHHTVHNEACGYVPATVEVPCNHVHDEHCGFILAVETIPATEEIPCDKGCVDTDGDGVIDHVADCAYTPAIPEIPAVTGAPCNHQHNETCGYAPASEGVACGYVCEECAQKMEDGEKLTLLNSSESTTSYNVWVAGIQVTSDNKDNITGEGITGTVTYDPDSKTLTLSDATITSSSLNGVIYSMGNYDPFENTEEYDTLNIVLSGTNSIEHTGGSNFSVGIYANYIALNISGEGLLNVTTTAMWGGNNQQGTSILAGNITITSGTIICNTADVGSWASSSYGMEADSITISGGTVIANTGVGSNNMGESFGMKAGLITISGGTVVASSSTAQRAGAFSSVPVLTDYTAPKVIRVGDNKDNVAIWDNTTGLNTYKYVKIAPPDYGDFIITTDAGNTLPTFDNGILTFGASGEYTVAMKSGLETTSNRIEVTAEDVTLNLDGITISAPQGAENSDGPTALTVTNGTLLNVIADSSLTGGYAGFGGSKGGGGIKGNIILTGTATLTTTGGSGGNDQAAGHGITGNVDVSGGITLIAKSGSGMAGMGINDGTFLGGIITVADGFAVLCGPSEDYLGPLTESSTTFQYVKIIPPSSIRSFDIAKGNITVEKSSIAGKIKVDYTDEMGIVKTADNIDSADMLTITQTNTETTTANEIVVNAGTSAAPVNITLAGVNISTNNTPFKLQNTAVVNLILEENTTNTLVGGSNNSGLGVPQNASVIIDGKGTLYASSNSYGSGIGSDHCGAITIKGGTVTASTSTNGGGAGIGGAVGSNGGTVVITGGNIRAVGSENAENIGKGAGGLNSGTLKNAAGDIIYLASFTEPTDNKDKVFTITKAAGAEYTYDLNQSKAIDGKWYVYLPVGVAEATYDGVTYTCTVKNDYSAVFTKKIPTVTEYLEQNPATPDTDYILNTTNKTLAIKTSKGAAWWSAKGNSYLDYAITLENDINVSDFLWSPVGNFINKFIGNFDGKGHILTNLTIDVTVTDTDTYVGMIGCSGGHVRNVGVVDTSISATGNSTTTPANVYIGGIVGYLAGGSLSNCYTLGTVSGVSTYGSVNAGGIVGSASSSVNNCYSLATVSASGGNESNAGGIAGNKYGDTIKDCYYLDTLAIIGTNAYLGTTLTDTQMKAASGDDALITKLNAWVNTQESTDYYTWKIGSTTSSTNDSYPVFDSAWTALHKHCVCDRDVHLGDHTSCNDITYKPFPDDWDSSTSLEGNYYLTHNVTMPAKIYIEENKTLNLCLNGYKLDASGLNSASQIAPAIHVYGTLNLCDCKEGTNSGGKITGLNNSYSPIIITNSGVFSMYSGSITQNTTTNDTVSNTGTFTMYGGSITGNTAEETAGVSNEGTFTMYGGSITNNTGCFGGVMNNGDFTMYGGIITDNRASLAGGGILSTTNIMLSGDVTISGNKVGNANNNIGLTYTKGDIGSRRLSPVAPTIKILSPLTNTTPIGVSIFEATIGADNHPLFTAQSGVFTSGTTLTNSDYASNFISDNSRFVVAVADDGQLMLKDVPIYVPVTNITDVPTTTTVGTDLTLTGTVSPADASSQIIVWRVKKATTTGATIVNGKLKTTGAGTVTVTATITNGLSPNSDYTKDFDITVTAIPQANTGNLYGVITNSEGAPLENARVVLFEKVGTFKSATTDANGNYTISDIPYGTYYFYIQYSSANKSSYLVDNVTISQTYTIKNMHFLKGQRNTNVELGSDTPSIAIGGINDSYDANLTNKEITAINNGGESLIILQAIKKEASQVSSDKALIQSIATGKSLGYFIDLSILKTVKDTSGNIITNKEALASLPNVVSITIPIPTELQGKDSLTVYRVHKGTPETLRGNPATGNEGYKISGKYLTIYTQNFSLYALGYTATNSGGGSTGSSSGSGSTGGSSYHYYNIKITKEGNGTISSDSDLGSTLSVREHSDKTFTFTPDKGYVISDVLIDDKSVGAVSQYTFENVLKDHSLKVIFKAITTPIHPQTGVVFKDVKENDWFVDAVYTAVNNNWFSGTSETTFSPYLSTTRGMIATVLWRMEKEPAASTTSIFEDVANDAYYVEAVNWAQENSIVSGYGNGKFGPQDNITREQMAAILYRYAQFKGYDVSKTTSLDSFIDGDATSDYAKEAMSWAVANRLISGKGNSILDPKAGATRAEVAAILTRFNGIFTQ
ncbi:hypothetical protein CS063_10465 [Sporanaerobium hydrogeniformans]|uniref:Uncharacterized protein n=1 Tax=Sporanaerobium hydrogeniformans TaxID=3072179 RepID=A0AC61DB98_9FIRM|nr:S-layer homology domain-containing protein [Sporanaerobium hydrogeniformans]PHV70501.1 hypothetical protein CS063_10465 [Sporanaerobium hydrogeniformans]